MNTTAQPMNDAILSVDHLTMRFGGLVAIGDVSFEARRGEITALIGPNGAGKTTVFNCITGFYKPTEGMLTMSLKNGQQFLLERLPGHEINKRAKVARTFQNIRLFSGMTVLENLLVAQHNKLMKASGFTVLGLLGSRSYRTASAESIELAKYWLEKAELTDRADDPAGDLPYGAQRRLEIARAMCTDPELLCLDEPAAGLNPRESLALNTLLMGIKNDSNTSILLIEHDMSVVMQISDHVVVLEYGRKISDGDPSFVKNDPKVIAAYLGVEDEEVENVLVEVGDEDVIETFDAEPDAAHGPGTSSSMMAGPISETIGHSDPSGEILRVSRGASRAARAKPAAVSAPVAAPAAKPAAPKAAKAAAKPAAKPSSKPANAVPASLVSAVPKASAKAPAASKPAAAKPAAPKSTAAKPAAKPAAKAPAVKTAQVKPAASKTPTKAAPAKAAAKPAPAAAKTAAKTVPAKAAAKPAAKPVAAKPAAAKPAPAKAPAPKAVAKAAPAKPVAKPTPAKAPAATKAAAKPAISKAAAKAPPAKVMLAKKPRRTSNWLAAPRGGRADDLLVIKGIGPINKKKLNEHGIFHFDQIAAWTRADIEAAEAYLEFDGRIDREDWIGQAAKLASEPAKPAAAKRGGK